MNKCFIPEKYLPGTVAIVTGGFSGIGLTLATEALIIIIIITDVLFLFLLLYFIIDF